MTVLHRIFNGQKWANHNGIQKGGVVGRLGCLLVELGVATPRIFGCTYSANIELLGNRA